MGSFNGINIGLKSLQVQRTALNTTGHNIANANNEGYSRQRVMQTASEPHTVPGLNSPGGAGQLGTGVKIEEIVRMRDEFIDQQVRKEYRDQGLWSAQAEGLERIEATFNEPSETSLNYAFDRFWQSLQDLGNNPEDPAARATVRQRGVVLTNNFHTMGQQLLDYQEALDSNVSSKVDEINSLIHRIADLNGQIVNVKTAGQNPNDLMDKRDLLVDGLNKVMNVQVRTSNTGNMNISLNGISIVNGTDVQELAVKESQELADRFKDKVIFADTEEEVKLNSGELKGIMNVRDEMIDDYLNKLDDMAEAFANRFNDVHSQGYDQDGNPAGEFFVFKGDDSKESYHHSLNIEVSTEIINSRRRVAAGRFQGNYSDNQEVATTEVTGASLIDAGTYVEIRQVDDTTVQYTAYDKDGNVLKDDAGNDILNRTATTGGQLEFDNLGFNINIEGIGDADIVFNPGSGSGDNAVELAATIKEDRLDKLDDSTLNDYYHSVISSLGVDAQRANQMVDNKGALLDQLEKQKWSTSGVSLDEEMANMIKFQQAYNAAARIITTSNEMLDTLMGIIR